MPPVERQRRFRIIAEIGELQPGKEKQELRARSPDGKLLLGETDAPQL
jgi:hypothetical protein